MTSRSLDLATIPSWFWELVGTDRDDERFKRSIDALPKDQLAESHRYADRIIRFAQGVLFDLKESDEDLIYDIAAWTLAQGEHYVKSLLTDPSKIPRRLPDEAGGGYTNAISWRLWNDFELEATDFIDPM